MTTTYTEPIGSKITYEGGAGTKVWAELPVITSSVWMLHVGEALPIPLSAARHTARRLVELIGSLLDAALKPLVVKRLNANDPVHTSRKWRATSARVCDGIYEYLPDKPYTSSAGTVIHGFWVNDGETWGGTSPDYLGPFTEILQ